ncbi:hypothetical protein [Malikia sp.]|uniref:hypothetical protein n=1 Tax=Malikia sp. TaxID=2070706 RepID=UPI0026269190|nr:hypothetical protein [Malikia sp.]MDD2728302.1 hypothetical protein [Malikia sp.]
MKIQPEPIALPMLGAPPHEPYLGADWTSSTLRTGCQDHLLHPSRRGDEFVFHRGHAITTTLPLASKA